VLPGGLSNLNYLVTADEERFVVRIAGKIVLFLVLTEPAKLQQSVLLKMLGSHLKLWLFSA